LSPVILEKFGLKEAILAFASEFEGRYQIKTITNVPDLPVLNMDMSLAIFRMLQESLTNAAKHAHASEVKVSIQCSNKQLKFLVEDNGRGINTEQINAKNSYGILSMKERTKLMGGSFSISGKESKGTQILIKLPLSQNHQ
jgi:signal transduction histidine kinase